jgi:hypothetical protein
MDWRWVEEDAGLPWVVADAYSRRETRFREMPREMPFQEAGEQRDDIP